MVLVIAGCKVDTEEMKPKVPKPWIVEVIAGCKVDTEEI